MRERRQGDDEGQLAQTARSHDRPHEEPEEQREHQEGERVLQPLVPVTKARDSVARVRTSRLAAGVAEMRVTSAQAVALSAIELSSVCQVRLACETGDSGQEQHPQRMRVGLDALCGIPHGSVAVQQVVHGAQREEAVVPPATR